jgi:hypothetical protein
MRTQKIPGAHRHEGFRDGGLWVDGWIMMSGNFKEHATREGLSVQPGPGRISLDMACTELIGDGPACTHRDTVVPFFSLASPALVSSINEFKLCFNPHGNICPWRDQSWRFLETTVPLPQESLKKRRLFQKSSTTKAGSINLSNDKEKR